MLIDAGADLNARTEPEKMTPLHGAATRGHADAVVALVGRGAKVNALTKEGVSPLLAAAGNGHVRAIQALIEAGADLSARGGELRATPLLGAALHGHADAIEVLIAAGAELNAQTARTA